MVFLAAAALAAWASPPQKSFSIEPPPGWEDVSAQKAGGNVLLALKGPEESSFMLSRVPRLPLENRAVVSAFLVDVLSALARKTGRPCTQASTLQSASFDNGLTFLHIRADLQRRPRLVLGVADFGGMTVLGTLISAVPDTLLPSILGGLHAASAAPIAAAGLVQSLDGQLLFSLPEELRQRPLSQREKKMGFVLALQGLGAELMVLKIVEEDAAAKDQSRIVAETVLSLPGVDATSLSPVDLLKTSPGPDLVYASAPIQDGSGPASFMAGYMPWGYWGYSILAKGSQPVELMKRAFGALTLGPSAQPKVVAATLPISLPRELRIKLKHKTRRAVIVVGTLLLVLSGAWVMRPRR